MRIDAVAKAKAGRPIGEGRRTVAEVGEERNGEKGGREGEEVRGTVVEVLTEPTIVRRGLLELLEERSAGRKKMWKSFEPPSGGQS